MIFVRNMYPDMHILHLLLLTCTSVINDQRASVICVWHAKKCGPAIFTAQKTILKRPRKFWMLKKYENASGIVLRHMELLRVNKMLASNVHSTQNL